MASRVAEWYAGKNVFITGGSGFVGLCLIEKLIRSVPSIGDIFVLLRPKKGKEIAERLEEIKQNLIFERLLQDNSAEGVFKRLKAVAGDVGTPNLGLSPEDYQLLTENIDVIFHSAATLDFAEPLKPTVNINLLGTRRMLELAGKCSKLKAFVHVSSAYVNSYKLETEEVIYPLMKDPEEVIASVEKLSEEELEEKTPGILGEHPNTYTFTKQMAEHEVQKMEERFPCTIVRPSMICGAWKEPIPGWTISKNGPQGFLMGAAKGVIRRLPVGNVLVYDYIPVDTVVNGLIVAGFNAGFMQNKKVTVYHLTSSTRNPFRWVYVADKIDKNLHEFPLKSAVWYPTLKFLPSVARFRFSAFFVHIIPALILDTVTRICGGRPILMKMHRNVNASIERLERFIFTEWKFHATKTQQLHKSLHPDDQKDFDLDISALVWSQYFVDMTKGVRRYLNKEKMSNLEAARGKDTILLMLHVGLQFAIYGFLWYFSSWITGISLSKMACVLPLYYLLFREI